MPNVISQPPVPRTPTLFSLELGPNGGVLAPVSIDELRAWINREIAFWGWIGNFQPGPHREAIWQAYQQLANALNQVNEGAPYEISNPGVYTDRIENAKRHLFAAYLTHKLPHTSSRLAKRVEDLRKTQPLRAIAYLYTQLANPNNYQFGASDFDSWTGFIEGLSERTKIIEIPKSTLRSATESVDELRGKVEVLLSAKQQQLDELHRAYEGLTDSLTTKDMDRSESWRQFTDQAETRHAQIVSDHTDRMAGIEAVFREKMTLRGPVEYWSMRQSHHERYSRVFGIISFLLIFFGGGALAMWAANVFGNIPDNAAPKAWQVSSLVVVAVFVTWAIRLIIRLFLSHSHLRTDAAERVVMTQTYLALLEEAKLTEEKDRSLILGALFRPASDGMVKDESIPHPLLDALTRFGGKGG
jgi:hypothetical protein